MTWFKVDDKFHADPRARMAGLKALGLWTLLGAWSVRYDTGGVVPGHMLRAFGGVKRDAERLVEAGLWVTHPDGWAFADFSTRQRGDYRPRIPAEVARAVIDRDWPACQICGGLMAVGDVQFDHLVPYARGGEDSTDNLRLAHDVCNALRGCPD